MIVRKAKVSFKEKGYQNQTLVLKEKFIFLVVV